MKPMEFEQLALELARAAAPLIGPGRILENFGEHKVLLDATSKFRVRDDAGNPEFVVLCSAAGGPEIVSRGVQRAREVADALGDEQGRSVLLPIAEGDVDGRTFAIFRYCTPLVESGLRWWIQRSVVRPRLVRWLIDSSRRTATAIPMGALDRCVYEPLAALHADEDHSPGLRELAQKALLAARSGDWQPRHVFMHDDLWSGNVLLDRQSVEGRHLGRFVVIDWAGARVRGYPLYDFLRLSMSFGLKRGAFYRALDQYCAALGYTRTQAEYAFANAAAELGQRLEHWPRQSYLSTIDGCYRRLMNGRD